MLGVYIYIYMYVYVLGMIMDWCACVDCVSAIRPPV